MKLVFDKGTLLLNDVDQDRIKSEFPFFKWDGRVGAARCPAYLYRQIKQANDFIPELMLPAGTVGEFCHLPPLRPYQREAISAWQENRNWGRVVLPTGSGKTFVALGAMAQLKVPTIIMVPTRVLMEQWEARLREFYRGPIGLIGDGNRRLSEVTIATFESAYRHMAQIGNRFKLMVVDEAHHFGVGVRDEALEMSVCPFRLGLTATDVTREEVKAKLDNLVGPKIHEVTLIEMKGKYLAPFELHAIKVDLSIEERRDYEKLMGTFRQGYLPWINKHPDSEWSDFVRYIRKDKQVREAYYAWKTAKTSLYFPNAKQRVLTQLLQENRNKKTLIFTPDTGTAYQISLKHLIMPITADIKRKEREDVLSRFRDGGLNCLVSCRVLNEGLDIPDAEIAIIIGGNHGEREHIQRIGRCLRPREGKTAHVYEVVVRNTIEVKHSQKRTRSFDTRIFA